ncbi:hypothetical protein C5C08_15990, partial [Rathayibacter rathayi]
MVGSNTSLTVTPPAPRWFLSQSRALVVLLGFVMTGFAKSANLSARPRSPLVFATFNATAPGRMFPTICPITTGL